MRFGLDARERRMFAAAAARTVGYAGVRAVARATAMARSTTGRGSKDLTAFDPAPRKVRAPRAVHRLRSRRPVQRFWIYKPGFDSPVDAG